MYQNNYRGSVNISPTRNPHFSESLLFVGTKKSFYRRKRSISHRIGSAVGLGHQRGRRFIFLGHQK